MFLNRNMTSVFAIRPFPGRTFDVLAPLLASRRWRRAMAVAPVLLVALAMLCATPSGAEARKFRVVTTFTVIADMIANVAGDAAEVGSITKPGAEIHDYQPTPRDIVKTQGADLVVWHGMNLERWFEKFFDNLSDVPSVVISEGIEPLGIGEGPYKGKPNPHAWMSPSNARIYIKNIENALVAA